MWNIPLCDYQNVKFFCPQLEGIWRELKYTFTHSLTLNHGIRLRLSSKHQAPAVLPPGKEPWNPLKMRLRSGLDGSGRRKISCPYRD
jgi:hypothetical protein